MNNFAAIVFGVSPFLLAAEEGKPTLAWEPCLTLVTEVFMLPGMFPINMWEAGSGPTSVPNLCLFVVAYLLTITLSLLCSQGLRDKKSYYRETNNHDAKSNSSTE